MRKSHRRPRNDDDFELLSLKLLRAHWKCPELERYATRGQAQHGVDLVDLSGQEPLRAAQCKLHEEGKVTTPVEVNDEIEKAKTFHPPLDRYLILTTGKVRKDVHDLLIEINRKHRDSNLFTVQVFDWNRIEELLDEYPDVQDSYEGGLPATSARRIESKLSVIFDHISEASGSEDSRDRFDIEIDEARDFLDKHEYQLGSCYSKESRYGVGTSFLTDRNSES